MRNGCEDPKSYNQLSHMRRITPEYSLLHTAIHTLCLHRLPRVLLVHHACICRHITSDHHADPIGLTEISA